jgi:DNA mismatch repair endonuclease MutH
MDINIELGYDRTNPKSIEAYAQKLIGKTFREVVEEGANELRDDDATYGVYDAIADKRTKGNVGQLIETHFFHYANNSDSRPDFPEAGVELKVTPYKENKNGSLSAKERLILTMIDYMTVVNEDFETSHFWNKSRLILLIYYLYKQEMQLKIDYRIGYAKLFTPPEQDLKIIKHDYEIIVGKIKAGKAHELSEGDTLYLGAATKSSTSEVRRKQPFSDIMAKPRAFSFKNSYMTYVLNNYIIPGKDTYEPIVKDDSVEAFEDYVVNKIDEYAGYSVDELCEKFDIDISKKAKNLGAMIAYRILGIKSNQAEEFEKANIVLKTIRIESNNKIKESMSFPTFKFKKLVQEEWDDSTFGNYLRETRFLFVVYKFDENEKLRLKGAQFWNIPYEDLENDVRQMWERTVQVLKEGLKVETINGINHNNFPKATENRVSHVRPHAQNAKDTYELPDGREYPKQCFWLNNSYILEQLDENLK